MRDEPKILLDSDVFRHFLNGGRIHQLPFIFPNRFVILEKVKDELCRSKSLVLPVNNFIKMCKIPVLTFPKDRRIMREYSQLIRKFGEGESACMAVARFEEKYIASSNLKDIKSYCHQHGITYYTTMDLLVEALRKGILTEAECDQFISAVKAKGSKLPCDRMREYGGR